MIRRAHAPGFVVQRSGEFGVLNQQNQLLVLDLCKIDYSQAAQRFERKLGEYLSTHHLATKAAEELVKSAWKLAKDAGLDRTDFGTTETAVTGSVGREMAKLKEVVKQGNFRERMTFLYNGYRNRLFERLFKAKEGVNQQHLNSLLTRPQELHLDRADREFVHEASSWTDYYAWLHWANVGGIFNSALKGVKVSDTTTALKPDEVTAPPLSERERSFALSGSKLQWVPGLRLLDYKLSTNYQQKAEEELRIVGGGRSGTAQGILSVARLLGGVDLRHVRLALLGWMISAQDHTFDEIMLGCEIFDAALKYEKGLDRYRHLDPMPESELKAHVAAGSRFPDYYLSEEHKDEKARALNG
jgi:hypothetical protein